MASAHIEISPTSTRLSGELRQFIEQLQRVQNLINEIKATYDQLVLGGDWQALGVALNVSATDAEAIYNLTGSVQGELNETFINQFLGRLG